MKKITKTELQKIIKEELDEGFFSNLFGKGKEKGEEASLEVTKQFQNDAEKIQANKKPGSWVNMDSLFFGANPELCGEKGIKCRNKFPLREKYKKSVKVFNQYFDDDGEPTKPMSKSEAERLLNNFKSFVEEYNRAYEFFTEKTKDRYKTPEDWQKARKKRAEKEHAAGVKAHKAEMEASKRATYLGNLARQRKIDNLYGKKVSYYSDNPDVRLGQTGGVAPLGASRVSEGTKLTKTKLKQIIQEELAKILKEN